MNTAPATPDDSVPGLDDLLDALAVEPSIDRRPKARDVVFICSVDWQTPMRETLEILKGMDFTEVQLHE
jgi:hypothetical protein